MLSGMPELRLGLNDKILFESTGRSKSKAVELEDVKFHQCVRLSRLAQMFSKYFFTDRFVYQKVSCIQYVSCIHEKCIMYT